MLINKKNFFKWNKDWVFLNILNKLYNLYIFIIYIIDK